MRDINTTLFEEIGDFLYNYDCRHNEVKDFLFDSDSFLDRQNKAIRIIENIMTVHEKKSSLYT